MINLVLDTNTWLYLCNGYDQDTSKHQSGLNFRLLSELSALVNEGKIRLFVNDIIFKEYKRNRSVAENHIKSLEESIINKRNYLKNLKKGLSAEGKINIDNLLAELEQNSKNEIQDNLDHIAKVEDLLYNKSEIIPIEGTVYKEVSDLAVDKKAPFHKKNNSTGDALILLSAAAYFKTNLYEDAPSTIFVSNNSDDYCESKGSNQVHEDLKPYFQAADISFELNIAKALKLSEEIIAQIDEYNKYLDTVSYCIANCKGEEMGTNLVFFDSPIEIKLEGVDDRYFNPDQMQLDLPAEFQITEDDIAKENSKNLIYIEFGTCAHCSADHVRCDCGNVNYSYGELHIECSCGLFISQDEDGYYHASREPLDGMHE